MPNNFENHLPDTFIKNKAFALRSDFKFLNFPTDLKKKSNADFIGRKAQISTFLSFLNHSTKGVYLVTGYRGMGKTSFVNHVVYNYRKKENLKQKEPYVEKQKIIPIHLTISQNNPKESDVLKQVVSSINDSFGSHKNKIYDILFAARYFFGFLLILVFGYKLFFDILGICRGKILFDYIDYSSIVYFLMPLLFIHFFEVFLRNRNKAHNRIKDLTERCFAEVSHENGKTTQLNLIKEFGFNFSNRKHKKYAIANTKEIEYELIQFLRSAKKEGFEFIFIFDELDKIEIQHNSTNLNDDLETFENRNGMFQGNHMRNRKKIVLSIITGLKNFFTTADARFIFIAGREMFDASLADISDKQSPLSSIFTYTFHIETLLKETLTNEDERNYFSLSVAIEEFLRKQLYYSESKNDRTIQDFITYLIYRSSGSPKKMIHAFHEFVKHKNTLENELNLNFLDINHTSIDVDYYLYFNSSEQYRLGFINSVYRPFIIQFGKSYKSFSENSVISIPYYFDHLFKFHPFAFSMSNLELIPDLISTNKTINLRDDIGKVINYLLKTHLRNTDIELFDYKFHSKTSNEIAYISKIFETEEAAFNFTLDESFPAKMILSEKIKEYRSIHSKFNTDPEKLNPQIFSIATLNSSLGDIYFFDQEYHDAVSCYSDAIRAINNLRVDKINFRDFIGLIRNKLKLGLCFEKIFSFEEALSFYSDSIQDIKRFYRHYKNQSGYFNYYFETNEYEKPFQNSSLNDLLQICVQAFLANLYIQEKMGLEGITTSRVKAELADFYRIVDFVSQHSGRNHMIIANSLLHQGKLLYYKNSFSFTKDTINNFINDYPDWCNNRSKTLQSFLSNYQQRRQPILALLTYIDGLDEVILSRTKKQNHSYQQLIFHDAKSLEELIYKYLEEVERILKSENELEAYTANHIRYMASFVSAIGDCLLGLKQSKKVNGITSSKTKRLFDNLFNVSLIEANRDFKICLNAKSPVTQALHCYYVAAQLYENYGQIGCALFEYQKIIQFLSHVLVFPYRTATCVRSTFAEYLHDTIIVPSLSLYFSSIGQAHRHIILKNDPKNTNLSPDVVERIDQYLSTVYALPNHQDIKEMLVYFKKLLYQIGLVNSHANKAIQPTVSSQHLRVLELEYAARILEKKGKKTTESDFIDYIYNRHSILRIFKIYGSDYIFGPSFNAHVHYKLAEYLNGNSGLSENEAIRDRIKNLIGGNSYSAFDSDYHYRMAIDYYKTAIELHTAGQEYNRKMKELVYLEDDFNDSRYHFGAALERYYMIHNVFSDKISAIKTILNS